MERFRRRGRWSLIIGTLLAALSLVGVALATSFDPNGTYTPLGGTTLHQTPPISNTSLTPDCTTAELASLPPGGVLWHFVLTKTTALNSGHLRADFQTAGLTDPDVAYSALNGGNPQWNIITPTADTLLNASTDAVGDQLNLSHVCYVEKASPSIVTDPGDGGETGDTLNDTATLSGGNSPTGTITFKLFSPSDTNCERDPIYTDVVDVSGNGDYDTETMGDNPGGYVSQVKGTYNWTADYSGDDNNFPADSGCGEEALVVEAATPTVLTEIHLGKSADETGTPTVVGGATHVSLGSFVHDSATASGGPSTPEGTVDFKFYDTIDCTPVDGGSAAGTVALDSSGVAHPSDDEGALAAGSYSFKAFYSSSNTDKWQDSESLCEPLTVDQAQLDAATTLHDADHNTIDNGSQLDLGAKVHDTAQITGQVDGFDPTGAVTFTYYSSYTECNTGGSPIANDGTEQNGDPKSVETSALAPGNYAFQASVAGDANYLGDTSDCEPFTVKKGDLTITTNIHDSSHNIVTSVPVNSTVHDTATLGGAVSGFDPTAANVTFTFYNTIGCTGDGTSKANVGADESTGDPRSEGVGPLSSGAYSFQATFTGDDNYNATDPSACEPLSVRTFGKTMGFWGNKNGQQRILANGGYAANAVNIGRGANIDTQAESLKVLPSTLNACGKGSPIIFSDQTLTKDCSLATGINKNSLNTLAAQTLALGYNIKLISGFSGQTIGALGCSVAGTTLSTSDTVNSAFTAAVALINGSASGGTTTQSQIGAMNLLLGCINAEA